MALPVVTHYIPDLFAKDYFHPKTIGPELLKILPPKAYKNFSAAATKAVEKWAAGTTPVLEKGKEDVLAVEAFAWLHDLLYKMKFKYVYNNVMPLFFDDKNSGAFATYQHRKFLEINCKGVASTYLQLLRFLGFPATELKLQISNAESKNTIKIVQKPFAQIKSGKVFASGGGQIDVAYKARASSSIVRTNGLKIRRTGPPSEKKPLGVIKVDKSERDPFENHFVAFIDNGGVKYKYFDPLTGCRYKNGQSDFFVGYDKKTMVRKGGNISYFVCAEDDRMRLYQIPATLDPVTSDSTVKALVALWKKDGWDQTMWWLIEAEDYADDYFRVQIDLNDKDKHPLIIKHVYGLDEPFSASEFKQVWDDAKTVFEKTTGKKKPSPKILGIRTGSGIDSALSEVAKSFYKRDASFDKAFDKLTKAVKGFQGLCSTAKKDKAKDADSNSKAYLAGLDTLIDVLNTICKELKANRPAKG